MTRIRCTVLLLLTACYAPPNLPDFEGVPLVPAPGEGCRPEFENADVSCVIDGDTFDVGLCGDGGERFRMLGIDTPETEKPGQVGQCYAEEAFAFLAGLIAGEEITVTFDQTCVDVFGRSLGYVWAVDDLYDDLARDPDLQPYLWTYPYDTEVPAILLNEVVLGEGYGRDYPEEIAGTLYFQKRLDEAKATAEQFSRGLWGACSGG
jgi:endonuclease YncB( thermonuclease family)